MANQDPLPDHPLTEIIGSRYAGVSRRAFLKGTGLAGLAGLTGLTTLSGLACGPSDAEVLAGGADRATGGPTTGGRSAGTATTVGSSSTTGTVASAASSPTASSPTAAPSATAAPTSAATTPVAPATNPSGLPASAEMVVDFTFTPAAGGRRVLNPYVAVWVEDGVGELLHTLALHIQPGNGTRWLRELRRWYELSANAETTAATISAATRPAGAYSFAWDCHGPDGQTVPSGTYFVCIEASREHGPYQLIREQVAVSARTFAQPLADSGELTNARVSLHV